MDIRCIPKLFCLPEAEKLTELNKGHINRTFLAVCGGDKYILQSLNRSVFHAPEVVMDNIGCIEAAFATAECSETAVPHFIACGDKNYAVADGEIWRIYNYIAATADTAANAAAAGLAFGTFVRIMDGKKLSDIPVIENFHDFDSYFRVLASKKGIEHGVMETLYKLRDDLGQVFTGALKKRIIHGDAKPDNVICGNICTIIDLDTAMYGHAAIDYGDLVRSVCRGNDLAPVREVTEGYAKGLCGLLDDDEVSSLYYGVLWITGELAVRYLIDSYSEVKYFRGKSSADCLDRANELFCRLDFFDSHGTEIKEMIMSCFGL